MKKIIIIYWALFLFSICSALAHSPTVMILDYDRGEKQLSVEITHPSNDINEHYIRKVTIKNNSQIVKEHYSFRQAHPHKFTLKFPLIAEAGDVIEVKVYCSEGGSRTAKLIIEEIE